MKPITKYLMVAALAFAVACTSKTEEKEANTEDQNTVAQNTQPKEKVHPGKIVYNTYCMACHMADGNGVAGMNPPLTETDYVLGDKERLIKIVLNGLSGAIEVKGVTYNSVMAAHGFLSDQQVADVLSYVRSNFGNDASEITPEEVAAVRAAK